MRLLGASKFYIKKPFLKEAVFFGLTSSVIVFSIFIGVFYLSRYYLRSYLSGVTNLSIDLGFYTLSVWPVTLEFAGLAFAFTAFLASPSQPSPLTLQHRNILNRSMGYNGNMSKRTVLFFLTMIFVVVFFYSPSFCTRRFIKLFQ